MAFGSRRVPLLYKRPAVVAGGSALRTNLISWWELDEASGTRNDSHTNAYHLTDNNTVTSGTGIGGSGTAAEFTAANSEYLSRASNADLAYAGDFSFAAWMRGDAADGGATVIGKGGGFGTFEWRAGQGFGTIAFFSLSAPDAGSSATAQTGSGTLVNETWSLVVGTYAAGAGDMTVAVNAGTRGTQTFASSNMAAGGGIFSLGERNGSTFFNGRVSKAAFWKRVLTEAEEDELYNAGAGITYAETAP